MRTTVIAAIAAGFLHSALLAAPPLFETTPVFAEWSGPLFRAAQRDGGKMVVAFDHAGGLKAVSGELTGFAIAGSDRKFVWAKTKVEHDKVIVWSDDVPEPAAVRYAWAANPKCNLVNATGLPASPFRTDDWK